MDLQKARRKGARGRIDSNGVRKAMLALLAEHYRARRHPTLAELLVALEVTDAQFEGQPHSMKSLGEKLEMPYSTVSRVVFAATSESAPGGVLTLRSDRKDRRRKHIELDVAELEATRAPFLRAVEQAMLDYYGQSVYKLKRKTAAGDQNELLQRKRRTLSKAKFDSNGVRKAIIAGLTSLYKARRYITLAEVLVAAEVIDAHIDGRPHTMRSLSEKLEMPYSSVSRIVFGLTSEVMEDGMLKLLTHSEDRRRKIIDLDLDVFATYGPKAVRPVEKALLDYYGDSVYKLKRKADSTVGSRRRKSA